jgi:hypothetical protein
MITPMIISPGVHTRPPTEREQADEAARHYSTKEEIREHFRAGAEWHIKKEECSLSAGDIFTGCVGLLALVYLLGCLIIGAVAGSADADFKGDRFYAPQWKLDRPSMYVFFPAFIVYRGTYWLFSKSEDSK